MWEQRIEHKMLPTESCTAIEFSKQVNKMPKFTLVGWSCEVMLRSLIGQLGKAHSSKYNQELSIN